MNNLCKDCVFCIGEFKNGIMECKKFEDRFMYFNSEACDKFKGVDDV